MKWRGLSVLLLTAACATTPLNDAASRRDWSAFEAKLLEAQKQGELSRRRVVELAETVLAGEVANAQGLDGMRRTSGFRLCARELTDELERRAETRDIVAATARRLLIELGRARLSAEFRRYVSDPDPYFRALAARSATSDDFAAQRRAWFKDGDLVIRRAALEAAWIAKSKDDVPDLLEVIRLDPDAMNRSLAARAAAATGSEQAILGLRDYWPRVSEGDRLTYVEAWSSKSAFRAGGERELEWVVGTTQGEAAIAAAAALFRSSLPERRTLGQAILKKALLEGTTRERQLAIRLVPVDDESFVSELQVLTHEPQVEELQVLAWQRLAELGRFKAQASAELRKLAAGKSATAAARHTLVAFGDEWVIPYLRVDLRTSRVKGNLARLGFAEDLMRIGDFSEAAILLADRDVEIRSSFSCFVVSQRGDD